MIRIALSFALAVAAIACTPEETVTPEIKVVPAESELLLPTEGGELTIKFNTNVDWTASVKEADAKEWCSLSPATGKPGDNTLKVIALENEGTENRTVTVVITAMEATAEVVVTQLQKDALVLTGNKSFEVPYQGQNLEFAVSHNSELKAEADVEWITEVKAKAVEESKLLIQARQEQVRSPSQLVRSRKLSRSSRLHGCLSSLLLLRMRLRLSRQKAVSMK